MLNQPNLIVMRKLTLAFGFILAFAFTAVAQQVGGPSIEFEKDVHDFGNVKQYGNTTTEFVFKNTGSDPLIISNARGSCGCTVPSWPKQPIAPGETAVIKVTYDSKRVGPINKSVTITSNASNEPTKVIRIKGNIEAAPQQTTMPTKNSGGAPVVK